MRHRNPVGGPQPAEIMPLHAPGKALADADADHIDPLPGDEMRGADLGADLDQRILGDAKLGEPRLGLDLGLGEMAALRLRHVLDLGGADAELQRAVAVLFRGPHRHHLAIVDRQHGHRHVVAVVGKDPGHAELAGEKAGAHRAFLRA